MVNRAEDQPFDRLEPVGRLFEAALTDVGNGRRHHPSDGARVIDNQEALFRTRSPHLHHPRPRGIQVPA